MADVGIVLTGEQGVAGVAAAVDDVFDAAGAAFTGRGVAPLGGDLDTRPAETLGDGLPCAIWV